MSSRHRPRLRLFWAGVSAVSWAVFQLGCTAYPARPADPAFDTDVRPIFLAHCVRCHGAGPDGGSRNVQPFPNGTSQLATGPCLQQFGNNQNYVSCQYGAAKYTGPTGKIIKYIHATDQAEQMPPLPAPRLNDWELDVIDTWASKADPNNGVWPVCSRSSNPDPELLCGSPGT